MACLQPVAAFDQIVKTTTSTMQQPFGSASSSKIKMTTTSTMTPSGSAYASQVKPFGENLLESEMSEEECYNYARIRKPRTSIEPNEEREGQDPGSPIGDAALPLLLFAMAYTAYVVVRKRRKLVVEEVARS